MTGWAALHWQGAEWFEGRTRTRELLPVPLALGDTGVLSRRKGVQFCHDWLFDGDVTQMDGMPLTRPERSVCVAALRARTVEETVQVVDMACASDLMTPDLFDPQMGVAGEYDGIIHEERLEVRRRDLDRENLARAYGIEVVSMISTDLQDLVGFERRLDDAYARSARATGVPRWTLDQPPGWVDTSTVEKRRALSPEDRERWLRWRSPSHAP